LGGDDFGPTIAADLVLGADAWVDIADIVVLVVVQGFGRVMSVTGILNTRQRQE